MQSLAILILRVGVGLSMLLGHGLPKLLAYSEKSQTFPDPLGVGSGASLGLAVFAEFFCAAFVILGLATRLVVWPLIITMLVALSMIHSDDPWKIKERAFLYLIPFVTLFFSGGGLLSLSGFYREKLKSLNGKLRWFLE